MTLPYLDHLGADSERFIAVLAQADLAAPVPSCPGWVAADLLWHLTEVQHFWGALLADRLPGPQAYERPEQPEDEALVDAFRAASERLRSALAEVDDATPCWTWLDTNQTAGFVRRRQAHEASIHRLDAELTVGERTPLDAELSTDGVLEALDWIFGGAPGWADANLDGPVGRLATTDTDTSWTIRLGSFRGTNPESGTTYDREPFLELVEPADPDFEIVAPAADLVAWVWNRPSLTEIGRRGDTSTFEALIGLGVD
ncbi:MAG: maleylpyruvate isomerase family mycothiol-dependent enzyme [Actinomycetota bacterium]